MNLRNVLCVTLSAVLGVALLSCSKPGEAPKKDPTAKVDENVLLLGDFEDGTTCGWKGTDGATVSVVSEHAASGTKALQVDLPVKPYPGVGLDLADGDWTKWDALRFSVYNPTRRELVMSIRIDDADSDGYGQRFNLEGRSSFTFGSMRTTRVELPMKALAVGTLESRGLHLGRIKQVRFFSGGLKEPATLVFDDFQLVRASPGTDTQVLADFEDTTACIPHDGTTARMVPGKSLLEISLSPEGNYPGIDLKDMPPDWLGYDLVTFNLSCPDGKPTPGAIAVKITDASGRSRTCDVALNKGENVIQFPIELAGQLALGDVKTLSLFTSRPNETQVFVMGPVSLVRVNSVPYPPVHAATVDNAMFTLDFTAIGAGGKNSCFGATVRVPLKSGGCRTFYCSSPGKDQLTYAAPADVLADMDTAKPIRVWAYFFDHGQWSWGRQEVKTAEGEPVVVRFTDRHALSK